MIIESKKVKYTDDISYWKIIAIKSLKRNQLPVKYLSGNCFFQHTGCFTTLSGTKDGQYYPYIASIGDEVLETDYQLILAFIEECKILHKNSL